MAINAQSQDEVLLIIAGKMVSVADFQSAYQRQHVPVENSKADVQQFLQLYVDQYLQVLEAEAQGLDAQPQYQALLAGTGKNKSVSTANKIRIADLFLPLTQHCTVAEQRTIQNRMDSISQAVESGADFMQVMQQVAPNTSSVRWIGQNEALADIEEASFRLSEGQVSSIVLTTDGFHLLKRLNDQTGTVTVQQTTDELPQDYRTGLLMHCLYEKEMKGKAQADKIGMAQYFENNLKNYAWDVPHYKGILYQCKDKKTLKKVRKLFTKQSMQQWDELITNPIYQSLFQQVKVETVKLYKLSDNELVDELAFGGPIAAVDAEYPFKGISGKVLKKHPDSYQDVKDDLLLDYQRYLEQEWIASLRKKYDVTVNEKALKQLVKNL